MTSLRRGLPKTYTVEQVADRACTFLYEQTYRVAFKGKPRPRPEFGFVVAGFSHGEPLPEAWVIRVDKNGNCRGSEELRHEDTGLDAFGQTEAIDRLLTGYSD